jgi:cytochrome c-type biogenesis protein CcmH
MMRRAVLCALLAVLLAAGPAAAATPRTTLHAMEEQVMCVVCKTPLAVANGPQADAERQEILALIAQGRTASQIKAALVREYGDRVLALPKEQGFNLAVYLVPIACVALALALLAVALPRWRRRSAPSAAAAGPHLSEEDARRLDEDLARYDG